jgi:hypothetical protein
VQLTSVVPIGNVVPDSGLQFTLTVPWPSVVDGLSKLIVSPPALIVAREIPSTQLIDGGLATGGGGGGGGGVGAVGVLQETLTRTTSRVAVNPTRVAQYRKVSIYRNQPSYRTCGYGSVAANS